MPSSGRWRRRLTRLLPPKSVQQDHGARRHAGAAGAWSGHGPRGHGGPVRSAHVAGDGWLGCVGHSRVAGKSSAPQLPSLRKGGPQRARLICTARLTHRPRATLAGADQALPTTPFEIRIDTAGADRRAGVCLGSRRNGRVVAASTARWLVDGRLRGADIQHASTCLGGRRHGVVVAVSTAGCLVDGRLLGADIQRAGVCLGSRRNGRVVTASAACWSMDAGRRGADSQHCRGRP
ncbi:hypothetical protein FHT03_002157 [Xanthomonas arboricola]